jgi:cell division protein FtsI (penicillin-binding protein 3)
MNNSVVRNRRVSAGLLRSRTQFTILAFLGWMLVILARVYYLQVIQNDYYNTRAARQRQSIITLDPERGPILDRKNRQLAVSIAMDSIYGIPEEIKDFKQTVSTIASIVPVDEKEVLQHGPNKSFVWITRKISSESADRIRKLKLRGVYFTQESRRFYPNKELASHVLGFVGIDNKGLSGVEYQYEHVVSGVPGKLLALRDAKRRLLLQGGGDSILAPTAGRTLQLSIDSAIQHIAERELEAAIAEQHASGGSVIIMNPYTGEILALANEPSFNPNAYSKFNPLLWKNRAIQDYYEPGSTFKPVVVTAAIDRGLVTAEDKFDCQWGSITLAGHVMEDHKPFGVLTVRQIIEKSSNVGMIKIGLKVGPETIFHFTDMFGFGSKTGIDLPGEGKGVLRPTQKWSAISIGAISIGQELGVTPIQVLRMMSSFANGGYLPSPHCVARVSDGSGQLRPTVFPEPQELPVKHSTIQTLREFLEAVVQSGSGTLAQIPGYRVAGKTGTAQKIGHSGSYADGGYIASFVGYAPAERPAFSMICILYEPKKEFYGGRVAAPLFGKIGQQVLKYMDIPPSQVLDRPVLEANAVAFPHGTKATVFPEEVVPVAYNPPDQHHKPDIVSDDDKVSGLVMPYLYGKTASEAIETLTRAGVSVRILGTGTVFNQWPAPGSALRKDDLCIISLETFKNNISLGTAGNASQK